ncbi:hypothetical protein H310_09222 [Aphanomyces invadans]|uniref:HSF-type DNA-binding domain-containing protein n=1 Tax=Aphanomyces invadans TaxID=157072 RepID=A0A024TV86_9STRA|nr:hypothetical protein H310_09222 [Aphanomyces invadans]ETV97903.1 hypothetical protein H310_09222 [Aphanomyces invadans]|eukprot:XP_008873464.1 hypothetical protein H310_09222 [Aphanomyces invadans]
MSTKRPTTSTFIRALYNLTRKGTPYVDWSVDGSTFRILDVKRFASEVLPRFFKHNNMASFQRQLNYFSFKKWTKNNRTMGAMSRKSTIAEFHHPSFTRDMDEASGNDIDWFANFDWEAHDDIIPTAGVLYQEHSVDSAEADNTCDMVTV